MFIFLLDACKKVPFRMGLLIKLNNIKAVNRVNPNLPISHPARQRQACKHRLILQQLPDLLSQDLYISLIVLMVLDNLKRLWQQLEINRLKITADVNQGGELVLQGEYLEYSLELDYDCL